MIHIELKEGRTVLFTRGTMAYAGEGILQIVEEFEEGKGLPNILGGVPFENVLWWRIGEESSGPAWTLRTSDPPIAFGQTEDTYSSPSAQHGDSAG